MRKIRLIPVAVAALFVFAGCDATKDTEQEPLNGLAWYDSYEEAKQSFSAYALVEERESDLDAEPQQMLDYSGVDLFDTQCDLTLSFSQSGLIGLNYRDFDQSQDYYAWFSALESRYGYPTEEGSGMASWYDEPLGANTSVYLFNLEEGVQISFYTTSVSPEKPEADKQEEEDYPIDRYVPTPELLSPVVPITPTTTATNNTVAGTTEKPVTGSRYEWHGSSTTVTTTKNPTAETTTAEAETGSADETTTTATSAATSATTPVITENHTDDFKIGKLEFYASPNQIRTAMRDYRQLYEETVEVSGQPWEIVMQYADVAYCNRKCDVVLCFTSLGLVGVNYFDPSAASYLYWISRLKKIYGAPTESYADYAVWSNAPVGENTAIYLFALGDGVQLSFFTDDTGSAVVE